MDGGADRNRTCDLLIANETLYQLSYDPIPFQPDGILFPQKAERRKKDSAQEDVPRRTLGQAPEERVAGDSLE